MGDEGLLARRPAAKRPFYELARAAQFRRLRPLALRALEEFDLGEIIVTTLQLVQNASYRVLCVHDGRQFLLRVHAPRWHDTQTIRSELVSLAALRADLGLEIPAPMRTRRGDLWTEACSEGVPEARVCTLMTCTALLGGYGKVRPLARDQEAALDTFLLARWVFLGLSFLSRPEHAGPREYGPRFLSLVVP